MINIQEAGERSSTMWLALAERLAASIPGLLDNGEVAQAVKYGAYADACFFQATGEAYGFTVNEFVLPKQAEQTQS